MRQKGGGATVTINGWGRLLLCIASLLPIISRCYASRPILLARVSNVLIFCYIQLVWTDHMYHQFAWRPYQTFPLSRYLAALDPLTCLRSPSYLSLYSHGHATPLAHLPLHQFWHAWVRSAAITKISSVAYSVPYQASVSPCLARWRIASASCDSIFLWLSLSCIVGQKTVPMFGCFSKIEVEQIKKIR